MTHRKGSGHRGAPSTATGFWPLGAVRTAACRAPPRPPGRGAGAAGGCRGLQGAACPAPVSSPAPLLHPRGRWAGGPSRDGGLAATQLSQHCQPAVLTLGQARPPSRQGRGASSPQGGLGSNLPQVVQRFLTDVDPLCLGSDLNDLWEKNCDQQWPTSAFSCHLLRP